MKRRPLAKSYPSIFTQKYLVLDTLHTKFNNKFTSENKIIQILIIEHEHNYCKLILVKGKHLQSLEFQLIFQIVPPIISTYSFFKFIEKLMYIYYKTNTPFNRSKEHIFYL